MNPKILLVGDTHFTDNPVEEYRWSIFKVLQEQCISNSVDMVVFLGDFLDRKDRHSATLVNRVVECLQELSKITDISILMGNHDEPVNGIPFWSFLTSFPRINYISQPVVMMSDYLFLPFSKNPRLDWHYYDLGNYDAVFIHQTINGAELDNGYKIDSDPNPMPILPRHARIYGGDVHRPQKVGSVTYVGTPYPVRFNEDWPGRLILLDGRSEKEIPISSILRKIIDIKRSSDLLPLKTFIGRKDQIRVRYHLQTSSLSEWSIEEQRIKDWAEETGCSLLSIEAILVNKVDQVSETEVAKLADFEFLNPEEILRAFCKEENLSDDLLSLGIELVGKSK